MWIDDVALQVNSTDKIDFKVAVKKAIASFGHLDSVRVLDIGGGKFPFLSQDDLGSNVEYVICDIDINELEKAPDYVSSKVQLDICTSVPITDLGLFHVVFSRMLAEHVPSGPKLYKNVFSLLAPGGVTLHFHPTLYAIPFVMNKILPNVLSRNIVYLLFPHRLTNDSVFPAYYDWCTSRDVEKEKRLQVGFSQVDLVRQFHNNYWNKIPLIGWLARKFASAAKKNGWYLHSSFALFICRK
jgi:SAM-dependent methyltransferase